MTTLALPRSDAALPWGEWALTGLRFTVNSAVNIAGFIGAVYIFATRISPISAVMSAQDEVGLAPLIPILAWFIPLIILFIFLVIENDGLFVASVDHMLERYSYGFVIRTWPLFFLALVPFQYVCAEAMRTTPVTTPSGYVRVMYDGRMLLTGEPVDANWQTPTSLLVPLTGEIHSRAALSLASNLQIPASLSVEYTVTPTPEFGALVLAHRAEVERLGVYDALLKGRVMQELAGAVDDVGRGRTDVAGDASAAVRFRLLTRLKDNHALPTWLSSFSVKGLCV